MRFLPSIVVALALLVTVPANAYTTRYEVQHAGSFTRTVNQALGTSVESYADGSVTLAFGTTPSPSLAITGVRNSGSAGNFFVEDDYDYRVTVVPLSAAAQALFASVGQRPNHIHLATATGIATLSEPAASGSRISSYVAAGGSQANFACESGVQCGTTHYRLALFLDHATDDPYLCTSAGCPQVVPGAGITFTVAIDAIFSLSGDATEATVLIDPTITLDPEFLADAGLGARDFAVTPEGGFGNGTGAVPEPASWALLIVGFGTVGAMLRRRSLALA